MSIRILTGDVLDMLATLDDESVHCVVTSPPYWGLRDYGVAGQIGLEPDYRDYITKLVKVFREVRRVLRTDGTAWVNLGDGYAGGGPSGDSAKQKSNSGSYIDHCPKTGMPPKNLMMMPARVALALQEDGWWLRSEIVWHKPNPMPESVTDRPTSAHEKIFLLAKAFRYYFDAEVVKTEAKYAHQPGMDASGFKVPQYFNGKHKDGFRSSSKVRDKQCGHSRRHAGFNDCWDSMSKEEQTNGVNIRNVWTVAKKPYSEAHFATYPPELIEPCIKAGCPVGGTVLDPFGGSGTTGLVADRLERNAILIELNPEYAEMARNRIKGDAGMFAEVEQA